MNEPMTFNIKAEMEWPCGHVLGYERGDLFPGLICPLCGETGRTGGTVTVTAIPEEE